MAEIRWTEESVRWLEDIYEYVSADNPSAASRILQGILDRVQDALNFPEIEYRYSPSTRNVRILLYGHYRIAYVAHDDGNISVLGVFHSALDITRYQF
ncbi:MAG: plasmid stabilization protein [Dehalococcoidia bacterium]|nr:plasmid stabilization protein [Dehalococcoidia bacterium]